MAGLRLVSGVSAFSLLDTLLGSLSSVSLDLVTGSVVQVLEWLVSDLVHSEGAVSSVVAWSVRHVEVTRVSLGGGPGLPLAPALLGGYLAP